jgi:glycosyltransferase involved in cell wall biosynthesis
LRILILNWRCPKNPKAGGAEFLTFEVAKRLVTWGHSVEWFSASFTGAITEEEIEGVHFVRAGRQWTVHWHAFQRYFRRLRTRFDLVIDEVNTIPFFTPLWADIPVFMLIYQLAREVWWYQSPFPISLLGFALEPLYLRLYRRFPIITESRSTQSDLQGLGFSGPITVVPIGVESIDDGLATKASIPTFLYVGRLTSSKRVKEIIQAFANFRNRAGTGQLWLLGAGSDSYMRSLYSLRSRLRLDGDVQFWGHLSTPDKHRRMAEAHVLLMASVREGWGLVVTEANACGTPAVVYDVPGLRDAVRHGETGLVVSPSPEAMAQGMRMLLKDPITYKQFADKSKAWSASFSLDNTARIMARAISSAVGSASTLEVPACL